MKAKIFFLTSFLRGTTAIFLVYFSFNLLIKSFLYAIEMILYIHTHFGISFLGVTLYYTHFPCH